MSAQEAPMPSIQGEAIELFTRVPQLAITASGGGVNCGSHVDGPVAKGVASRFSGRRHSTSAGGDGKSDTSRGGLMTPQRSHGGRQEEGLQRNSGVAAGDTPQTLRPEPQGAAGRGGRDEDAGRGGDTPAELGKDTNETKSKLLGGYLRERLLANITAKEPAKELVKRSFRHLHRGQGHVLTLDEFKEGLSNTFGALIPLKLIHATFDIFDTEPRTWQLDFDEFCHWLETGERALNSHGIMKLAVPSDVSAAGEQPAKVRKPRANDTSGEFKSSVNDPKGGGMSLEQADRAQLKAHLIKHRHKLHKASGLTDAQKSIVDHILMEKIKARRKRNASASGASSFDALEDFKALTRGNENMAWPAFKKEVVSMLPHLHEESEIREAFSRMDHNGDGVVDLTDFLMWAERMQEGRGNTDFWALQEEDHLEQIKLARSKASNLLVPDDYDGSTYHAKLSRELAEKKRAKELRDDGRRTSTRQDSGDGSRSNSSNRDELAQALRDNILSQVKGGTLEMLRAFRHFRPAAAGRRLFMDYREFRESIKQKGLGLSEEDTKRLFGSFDVDGSGEIDFSEFRRFLEGGMHQTGLAMGVDRHQEKTNAARSRVAALENRTALDPSLAGDARSDQLLKAKVLKRISGGQSEVLRALRGFGTDGGKSEAKMDYRSFASAIKKSDFGLSEPEIKQVFNKFRLSGPSGEVKEGLPTGEISAQAFRDWLLESHTSTSLDVGIAHKDKKANGGEVAISEEQATEHLSLLRVHTALRAKVIESFKTDHRNLLRAFRGVTRRKGSGIMAGDFREALISFGLCDDKLAADRLFKLYDWRNEGSISFQELMETITSNAAPPSRLTTSQRKRRLEEERRLPEEAIRKAEVALRRGLWSKHPDNVEACFRALTGGKGGAMGLEGLRKAVKIGGITGIGGVDQALKQVLQRHATDAPGSGVATPRWSFQDFVSFYRPADCRKAIALAKERDGEGQTEEELQRAALAVQGNKARTRLINQVRRLSQALRAADGGNSSIGNTKGMPPGRSGIVSRKTFAKALAREGGLGKVGEGELTRLLTRHGCSEQGGSYVNYPLFVASFTAAVRGADSASAIAAVAAADTAATAASPPLPASRTRRRSPGAFSGTVSPEMAPMKFKKDGVGDIGRATPNPQLALLPPRPHTATAVAASRSGAKRATATLLQAVNGNGKASASPCPSPSPLPSPSGGRAQTADSSLQHRRKSASVKVVRSPSQQGYFKRFTASGGDIDSSSLMKGSKSASALPDLVGQRPEVPKTTPIHRVMKKDVARSAKDLRKAFKQCENPYRRGVVSVKQFQAVCQKNGVTVDREDMDFLLRLHRHKPSAGGKYAMPPKWAQTPPPGAADLSSASRDTSKVGVRYDEFLRTCLAATEVRMVEAN